MLAGRRDAVVRGRALEQLDIGHQAGVREEALEEIVTQQRVLRHAPRERRLEGVHVVDPLAGVRALPEEVLVDVGHGGGIRVDPGWTRRQALERGARAPGQGRRDSRLQHRVSRPVEGMRYRADQPIDGAARQPRVGVERDHVADVGRHPAQRARATRGSSRARGTRDERRVRCAPKQTIQLVELPALALPPHPHLLALVPDPPAVEEEEPLAVAPVQARDALARRRERLVITRHPLRGRVRPVGEDREADVAVGIRQVVHLEPLDLLIDLRAARQQGRHDDHGPQARRHALAQLESRQRARAEQRRDAAIHERDRQVRRRDEGQEPEQEQPRRSDPRDARMKEGQRENQSTDQDDAPEVSGRPGRDIGTTQPAHRRRPAAERALEVQASVPDEVDARMGAAPDRLTGHVQLGAARAPRQLFDRVAVGIASREVHRAEAGVRAEHFVDQAHALEELGPVERGHQAHAQDHVPDGDVHRGLTLMLDPDDVVGGRPLARQALVQPEQRRRDVRVLIAQPLDELHREGGLQRRALEALEHRRVHRPAVEAKQVVSQRVSNLTRRPPANDGFRQAPEILDEHDPQRDRHRPQLADRQRLHALVGAHEPAKHLGIEPAVRVRDEGPGQPVDARITSQRTVGQLG